MKCPKCGGTPQHYLTCTDGKRLFQCTTGLTGFRADGSRRSTIYPCDTICDEAGKLVRGFFAYMTGGEVQTLKVEG